MKVLLIHGVGHAEATADYYKDWKTDITNGLQAAGFAGTPEYVELTYDDYFTRHYSGPGVYATAIAELAASATEAEIIDPIRDYLYNLFHPSRDLVWGGDTIRWTAGMVAQFAIEDSLRSDVRDHLFSMLNAEEPDLVAAHSMGSLISYDFLVNDSRASGVKPFAYLTFGSQINNVFVRSKVWPGRLIMPAAASTWTHLYNDQDHVFTADIALPDATNFASIATSSPAGHSPVRTPDGPGYLDHPNTLKLVWPALARQLQPPPPGTADARAFVAVLPATPPDKLMSPPRRRALLIGINEYPDPANRLEGCVNDTFLVSELLQEQGFAAEDIRVVLNDRATAAAIRERLDWLLADVGDGMERVFYFSGHGAQIPNYNAGGQVDHVTDCLVPYDFAWTKETAITDEDFYQLYSDLPFSAHFFAVLDCCHAGGMARDGSQRARGLTPPDDIRHRLLKWNPKTRLWERRELPPINPHYGGDEAHRTALYGRNGATYRLGRGSRLSGHISQEKAHILVQQKRALYVPVVMEACAEAQLAYEYRHGTTSQGAFTYALARSLRAHRQSTFVQLMKYAGKLLHTLEFAQTPQLFGPAAAIAMPVVKANERSSADE